MIHHIPGPAGTLEALVDDPGAACTTARPRDDADRPDTKPPTAAVVFCHPHPLHGGTMHTKVVYQAAKAFCRLGCAVLRFNFRGVGVSDGAFDEGVGEKDDFRAGIDFMARRYPGVPIWAAGMSFGSWIAMTAGAEDDRVTTLVGIAVPIATLRLLRGEAFDQAEVLHPRRARRDSARSAPSANSTGTHPSRRNWW